MYDLDFEVFNGIINRIAATLVVSMMGFGVGLVFCLVLVSNTY